MHARPDDPATANGPARRRWLVPAALAVALVLRLAFSLGYWTGKPLTHDEREYLHLADSLAHGEGLRYTSAAAEDLPNERFGRAPLYPAFVAAVEVLFGPEAIVRNVRIAQSLVGVALVWLLAAVARRAAGDGAAVAAAWIAAIYPPLVWIGAYLLSEALFAPLAFATVLVLGAAVDGRAATDRARDRGIGLSAGLLAGAAVLTRPAMLFFLMLAGLMLLARRRAGLLVALALGAIVVVAPWTARNYREYHRFVLVASEGGITFWTGNHPLSPGEGDMAANPALKIESRRLRAQHATLTEEEMEPIYYRDALAHIRHDPVWWVGLLGRKLFYTVVPIGPSYTLHSALYRLGSMVSYLVVLVPGIAGLVAAWRRGCRPVALLLLAGSAVLVCVVFLPQERFRIPVIDPTLVVGTAALVGLRGARPHPAAKA